MSINEKNIVRDYSEALLLGVTLMLLATIAAILFVMAPTITGETLTFILKVSAIGFGIGTSIFLSGWKEQRDFFDFLQENRG